MGAGVKCTEGMGPDVGYWLESWCKSAPIKKRLNSHQVSVVDDVEVSLLVDVFLLVMDRLNLRCLPHASHRLWLVEILCRSTHEFQFVFRVQ